MQHGAAHLLGKHLLRKFTAGSSAHVQLERAGIVRRRGDGEAAPPALGQHDVDVLPRLEIETLGGRQPQVNSHHIVREPLDALDAARQALDAQRTLRTGCEYLEQQIAAGVRPTEQHESIGGLVIRQAERPTVRVGHLALEQSRSAGSAVAAQAAMRHVESRAQSRVEHRLGGGGLERPGRSEQLDAQLPAPSRPSYYVDASRAALA